MSLPVVPKEVHDSHGRVYGIQRKIGKGAFATVHETLYIGKIVALKAVKTNGLSQKVADKFLTELQIHSKLRQRNIVGFLRAFSRDDNTYMVLEICENGSLKDMIAAREYLSLPEIRRFGIQLCGALHYVHQRGVIHRDIKAANVFLDIDMSIKLGDFGLAGILVGDEELGDFKRRVTVCGTPNYIAPEVLSKKKGHVTKADIWSLGVLFFHMMTGKMPFSSEKDKNNAAVFNRVAAANFDWAKWPAESTSHLNQDAKALVRDLLKKDETLRPSAVEIAQHVFFKSHAIPSELSELCKTKPPTWLKVRHPREMNARGPKVAHSDILKECGLLPVEASALPLTMYYNLAQEIARDEVPQLPIKGIYERKVHVTKPPTKPILTKLTSVISKMAASRAERKNRSESPEASGTTLLGAGQGTALCYNEPDAKLLKGVLTQVLELEPVKESGNGDLPPTVIYSCESASKWGTGFVLSDGSIGVLSSRRAPAKMVVVSEALPHLLLHHQSEAKTSPLWASGPIPRGLTCIFYEQEQHKRINSTLGAGYAPGESPVVVHTESSNEYQTVAADSDGKKLASDSPDTYYNERCRLLTLWVKFANFMVPRTPLNLLQDNVLFQAFGNGSNDDSDNDENSEKDGNEDSDESIQAAVDFYTPEPRLIAVQNIGNVRAWAWSNGGIQFDFPDGGKIALSSSGTRFRVICWPLEPPSPPPGSDTKRGIHWPGVRNRAASESVKNHARSQSTPEPVTESEVKRVRGTSGPPRHLPKLDASEYGYTNAQTNFLITYHDYYFSGDVRNLYIGRFIANGVFEKLQFMIDAFIMWSEPGNSVGRLSKQKLKYTLSENEEAMKEMWITRPAKEKKAKGNGSSNFDGLTQGGKQQQQQQQEEEDLKWGISRL